MNKPSFWVVETARTTYWDGRMAGPAAHYTDNINDAMQFARERDAEVARCWLLPHTRETLRSVEHMYAPQREAA